MSASQKPDGQEPAVPERAPDVYAQQDQNQDATAEAKASTQTEVTSVEFESIKVDPSIQCRAKLDEQTVKDYMERMKVGEAFPPVTIVDVAGHGLLLADGFHRYEACKRLEHGTIRAQVSKGTYRDALHAGINGNLKHGLRLSRADKNRAVELVLKDDPQLLDHPASLIVGVSHHLVNTVRQRLVAAGVIQPLEDTGKNKRGRKPRKASQEIVDSVPSTTESDGRAEENMDEVAELENSNSSPSSSAPSTSRITIRLTLDQQGDPDLARKQVEAVYKVLTPQAALDLHTALTELLAKKGLLPSDIGTTAKGSGGTSKSGSSKKSKTKAA